jgi:RNA-directed DNA polymerase
MIFTTLRGRKARRLWILDADLAGAFDHIDHDQLLASIGLFPARDMIRRWLKAGVIEKGRFTRPETAPHKGAVRHEVARCEWITLLEVRRVEGVISG